jgi:hypothetical protein
MKAIRDVHFFFQEESGNKKKDEIVLPDKTVLKCVCAVLEFSRKSQKNA